jgi:hypothetical protein
MDSWPDNGDGAGTLKLWQAVIVEEQEKHGAAGNAGHAGSPSVDASPASSHAKRLSKLGWSDTNAAPAPVSAGGGIIVVTRGWEHAMHAASMVQQRQVRQGALNNVLVATESKLAEHGPGSHWLTARARVLHARVIANCKITQLQWRSDTAAPWVQFDGWHISMVR